MMDSCIVQSNDDLTVLQTHSRIMETIDDVVEREGAFENAIQKNSDSRRCTFVLRFHDFRG